MQVIIYGKGHKNILATHKTTVEFTKEKELTKKGNCIVAVSCNKSCNDLPENFKRELKAGKKIKIIIKVGNLKEEIIGYGSKDLELSHKKDIVIRKSSFVDSRTLCINANKSANDLNRNLIEKIKNKNIEVKIILKIVGS